MKLHEEYHLLKKTFSISVPELPPHILLLHVTVNEEYMCNNDSSCWAILEIDKLTRKFLEFGKKKAIIDTSQDDSEYTIPNIFDIKMEWNCSFFPFEKITIPSYFEWMMKPNVLKYEVELPTHCHLLPNETLVTADLSDYTVDIGIELPSEYYQLELFLLNVSSLIVNIDDIEYFHIIEKNDGVDLFNCFKTIVIFDDYPNVEPQIADETDLPSRKVQKK